MVVHTVMGALHSVYKHSYLKGHLVFLADDSAYT